MTFATETGNLATRVKQDIRLLHEIVNGVTTSSGYDSTTLDITSLVTTNKASLIAAINEVSTAAGAAANINDAVTNATNAWSGSKVSTEIAALIDDASAGAATTYSSNKITADIAAAVAGLVDSSPAALDTLQELATALGNDPAFATTITTSIGLKANSADVYLKTETYSQTELGDPTTSYVTVYDNA